MSAALALRLPLLAVVWITSAGIFGAQVGAIIAAGTLALWIGHQGARA